MATKLLTDHHIPHSILDIVETSRVRLDIVTPFWGWKHLTQRVGMAVRRGVKVRVLLRLEKTEDEFYQRLTDELSATGVDVHAISALHAKICVSESSAIIGSMNMLGSSATGSHEAAILIADPLLLAEIQNYVNHLVEESLQFKKTLLDKAIDFVNLLRPERPAYCIRCKKKMPFNPELPLCSEHYAIWLKYKRNTYQENFCHDCGESWQTSFGKPFCLSCYKANQSTGLE